jgi:hypothetical protein
VVTKNATIPTDNIFITSCALESLSQREISEENKNSTFEISKEKEVEKMENCERKYNDVIVEENEIYNRKIKRRLRKQTTLRRLMKKKNSTCKKRVSKKENFFLPIHQLFMKDWI